MTKPVPKPRDVTVKGVVESHEDTVRALEHSGYVYAARKNAGKLMVALLVEEASLTNKVRMDTVEPLWPEKFPNGAGNVDWSGTAWEAKIVTPPARGGDSPRVSLPGRWVGRRVMVLLLES